MDVKVERKLHKRTGRLYELSLKVGMKQKQEKKNHERKVS